MLLIKTLGGLAVYDGAKPLSGAAQQPRRLAILAVLARAGERGLSRDRLLALLWPETDEERARRGLNQALYALRQDLGNEDAIAGNRDLRLDGTLIDSDTRLFAEERAAGRLEAAAALWGGPFLQGFNLPGLPEFERWVEQERIALTHDYAEVLETLAGRLANDPAGAVPWWRKLAALDPLNTRSTEALMRAQALAGDEAAALRQAEIFAALYEVELGAAPDPKIAQLAARIRNGELRRAPAAAPAAPAAAAPAAPPTAAAMAVTSGWAAVSIPPARGAGSTPSGVTRFASIRQRSNAWLVAGAVAVAALALAFLLRRSSLQRSSGRTPVMAVGRIVDYTKSPNGDRSAPLGDMLATNLARVRGLEVVSTSRMYEVLAQLQREGDSSAGAVARAARLTGATELVDGALYEVGPGRLRLDLRRVNLATGSVRSAQTIEGTDLFALADSATHDLAMASGGTSPEGTLASVSTTSEAAYRFYDAGLRAFSRGEFPPAAEMFRSALTEDSTFAMAAYYLGLTAPTMSERLDFLRRALVMSERSGPRDRLYVQAGWGFAVSDPSFLAVAESLATLYPNEVDGHYWRAQALVRDRQYGPAIPIFNRVIAMDSLGLRPGAVKCVACDAFEGLIYTLVAMDSLPAAERTVRRWIALQPDRPAPYARLSGVLNLMSREGESVRAIAEAQKRGMSESELVVLHWVSRFMAEDYAGADSITKVYLNGGSAGDHDERWYDQVLSLRAQGRLHEALDVIAAGRAETRQRAWDWEMLRGVLLLQAQTLAESGRWREAAALFDSSASAVDPRETDLTRARSQVWALALAASARIQGGDTTGAEAAARRIDQLTVTPGMERSRLFARYVRALQAMARNEPADAVTLLDAARFSPTVGFVPLELHLGEALVATGKAPAAVTVLQPTLRGYRAGGGLFVTTTVLHQGLARAWDAAGNADSARWHWSRVADAWRHSDPVFATQLAEAKARAGQH